MQRRAANELQMTHKTYFTANEGFAVAVVVVSAVVVVVALSGRDVFISQRTVEECAMR